VATNQYDKAIEDFNAALNVDSKDANSWAWRGVAMERKGDKSQALESYTRALTIDNGNSVARQGSSRLQGGGVAGLFRS
jgi:tetratricopeptide (TPR) repeat protein